jgi:hypothetical protein
MPSQVLLQYESSSGSEAFPGRLKSVKKQQQPISVIRNSDIIPPNKNMYF